MYRFKHTLTLTRNNDNDAIFRANAADAGKIMLSKISWFMPHVTPADEDKMKLYKIIERKEKLPVGYRMIQCDTASIPQKLPVGYRMIQCDTASIPQAISFNWRLSVKSSPELPRFIIVGFQTNKSGNQETNLSVFDNVRVSNIYVMLNSMRYPTAHYNISFLAQKFSRVYSDAAEFRSKFFKHGRVDINPQHYPLGL